MKLIIFLVGVAAMFTLAGCEEEHEHHHEGGAHDGYYGGYGHGEYVAPAPNHWEHRDD